jgi:hypothetical protein
VRLEDVRLAIRPRSILECLDIAFLFCGRHWVGVLLASMVGVVPFALLNWWVFQDSDVNPYLGYLLLAMETPWATMLLTLYLGQVTFSRRFSLGKAGRDCLRALGQMMVFQVVIRGLCLVIVVLAPMVFLGMYYLNEIILLEQTPLTRTWSRRTALNTRALSRILSLRLIDMIVLIVGTLMLASLLRTISELWEDRYRFQPDLFIDDVFVFDWQTQVAFWLMIVFLKVFRFVTYLDCRIRREGWDVELKLRAQAELHHQREVAQ